MTWVVTLGAIPALAAPAPALLPAAGALAVLEAAPAAALDAAVAGFLVGEAAAVAVFFASGFFFSSTFFSLGFASSSTIFCNNGEWWDIILLNYTRGCFKSLIFSIRWILWTEIAWLYQF